MMLQYRCPQAVAVAATAQTTTTTAIISLVARSMARFIISSPKSEPIRTASEIRARAPQLTLLPPNELKGAVSRRRWRREMRLLPFFFHSSFPLLCPTVCLSVCLPAGWSPSTDLAPPTIAKSMLLWRPNRAETSRNVPGSAGDDTQWPITAAPSIE